MTVPQAAQRVGGDPETVRRWIRTGKLSAERVGTQHMLDEAELDHLSSPASLPGVSLSRNRGLRGIVAILIEPQ